jgi:truncated hemoglobin YjbI
MASQIAPDPNRRMLIDGIGGEAKIEQLVKIIIDRIYADARINTFFAGIDATKMKERLKLFLIQLTGGAKKYEIVS